MRLLGVAHVNLVGVRCVPVDLDVELVGLFPGSALAQVVVAEVAQGRLTWRGIKGLVAIRLRANWLTRLTGIWLFGTAGQSADVDYDRRARAKTASTVAPGVGKYGRERIGRRRLLPSPLVIAEEEQLVLHDRPASRAAEDLAVEVRLAAAGSVGRPRRRRQFVVAPIVEAVAANSVGSRLDDHVDDRPGDVAELGRVVVGLDADLLHRVRARLVGDQVVDGVVHVDAVDMKLLACSRWP